MFIKAMCLFDQNTVENNVKFNLFLLNFQQLNNFCNLLELQCALRRPIGTRLI